MQMEFDAKIHICKVAVISFPFFPVRRIDRFGTDYIVEPRLRLCSSGKLPIIESVAQHIRWKCAIRSAVDARLRTWEHRFHHRSCGTRRGRRGKDPHLQCQQWNDNVHRHRHERYRDRQRYDSNGDSRVRVGAQRFDRADLGERNPRGITQWAGTGSHGNRGQHHCLGAGRKHRWSAVFTGNGGFGLDLDLHSDFVNGCPFRQCCGVTIQQQCRIDDSVFGDGNGGIDVGSLHGHCRDCEQ